MYGKFRILACALAVSLVVTSQIHLSVAADDDDIDELEYLIPGKPGVDYPILSEVPKRTKFRCAFYEFAGYFADTYADCQVYHICFPDGRNSSTLCVNGTIFNQRTFTCDWWYKTDCAAAPSLYNLNLFRKPPLPAGARRVTQKPRRRPYVRIRPRTSQRNSTTSTTTTRRPNGTRATQRDNTIRQRNSRNSRRQ